MARYAIIENDLVVNVIVAEQDFIDAHYPDAVLANDAVYPGWNYINNQFISPPLNVISRELTTEGSN